MGVYTDIYVSTQRSPEDSKLLEPNLFTFVGKEADQQDIVTIKVAAIDPGVSVVNNNLVYSGKVPAIYFYQFDVMFRLLKFPGNSNLLYTFLDCTTFIDSTPGAIFVRQWRFKINEDVDSERGFGLEMENTLPDESFEIIQPLF